VSAGTPLLGTKHYIEAKDARTSPHPTPPTSARRCHGNDPCSSVLVVLLAASVVAYALRHTYDEELVLRPQGACEVTRTYAYPRHPTRWILRGVMSAGVKTVGPGSLTTTDKGMMRSGRWWGAGGATSSTVIVLGGHCHAPAPSPLRAQGSDAVTGQSPVGPLLPSRTACPALSCANRAPHILCARRQGVGSLWSQRCYHLVLLHGGGEYIGGVPLLKEEGHAAVQSLIDFLSIWPPHREW
jgi:hypothetical protein